MPAFRKLAFVLCLTIAPAKLPAAEIQTITGFSSPESVLVHDDRRYVSNIGKVVDPTGKDGDGFISELDAAGAIVDLHAFPPAGEKLDAPKGMAVIGDTLYVADIDRVVGFSLASRRKVLEAHVDAGEPSLLNDLAPGPDGSMLVTDTLRGTLSVFDPATGGFKVVTDDLPGANGVIFLPGENAALVVTVGAGFSGGGLFQVDLTSGKATRDPSVHGVLDGIARLEDHVLVSDWVSIDKPTPGRLIAVEGLGGTPRDLTLPRQIKGPADFAFDADAGKLWVPSIPDNGVLVLPMQP